MSLKTHDRLSCDTFAARNFQYSKEHTNEQKNLVRITGLHDILAPWAALCRSRSSW